MFSIKGRHYKVEYEGLHLLCLSCGKYGHFPKNCPHKKYDDQDKLGSMTNDQNTVEESIIKSKSQDVIRGPWMVVNKSRRRKMDNKVDNKDMVVHK